MGWFFDFLEVHQKGGGWVPAIYDYKIRVTWVPPCIHKRIIYIYICSHKFSFPTFFQANVDPFYSELVPVLVGEAHPNRVHGWCEMRFTPTVCICMYCYCCLSLLWSLAIIITIVLIFICYYYILIYNVYIYIYICVLYILFYIFLYDYNMYHINKW